MEQLLLLNTSEESNTTTTTISKKRKLLEEKDWLNQVFGVNQIMFTIWNYFDFPTPLSFSAVHSTWRQRLWPFQTIPPSLLPSKIKQIKKQEKEKGRKKKKSSWETRITTTKRRKIDIQIIKKETKNYQPDIKNQTNPVPITSLQALYASEVKKIVFVKLPISKCHLKCLLTQLFTSYSQIETVEFNGGMKSQGYRRAINHPNIAESFKFDHYTLNSYTNKSIFDPKNVKEILSKWHEKSNNNLLSLKRKVNFLSANIDPFIENYNFKSLSFLCIKDIDFLVFNRFYRHYYYKIMTQITSHLKIETLCVDAKVVQDILIRLTSGYLLQDFVPSILKVLEFSSMRLPEIDNKLEWENKVARIHTNRRNWKNRNKNIDNFYYRYTPQEIEIEKLNMWFPVLEKLIINRNGCKFKAERQELVFKDFPSSLKEIHYSSCYTFREEAEEVIQKRNIKLVLLD